jgi:prolyl oligopeptidase
MATKCEAADAVDPLLWLEDVDGDAALAWVRARNEVATRELEATPGFAELRARLLSILDNDARIPVATRHGGLL